MRNIKIQGWIYYLLNLWIIKNQLDKKLWETWKYKVEYIFEFLFFFFLDCKSSRAIFVQWVWWGRQSLNHQLFGIIQWFCQTKVFVSKTVFEAVRQTLYIYCMWQLMIEKFPSLIFVRFEVRKFTSNSVGSIVGISQERQNPHW